jgi:dihydrofolate reductase
MGLWYRCDIYVVGTTIISIFGAFDDIIFENYWVMGRSTYNFM